MQRILVTGNAGSGKTTLSLCLASKLGLSVIHMDKIVWGTKWGRISKAEISQKTGALISAPKWIVDGVSSQVCHSADTIVFLDFPILTCLRRALLRTLRHLFSPRPEVPAGCSESRIVWEMTKIIFQFNSKSRPRILELLKQFQSSKRIFHIRSNKELESLLALIDREHGFLAIFE
jgi:adenylate kinase family enzyme